MSLNGPPRPERGLQGWSCPGKVFLLGEYAVLAGVPALVASVAPRFELSVCAGSGAFLDQLAEASPAGRLLKHFRERDVSLPGDLEFRDPHEGAGGFGASTAQFALLALAGGMTERKAIWKLYRELTAGEPIPPSAADLACQLHGGIGFYDIRDPRNPEYEEVSGIPGTLLVFSAAALPGRKVATHEHLQALSSRGLPQGAFLDRLAMIVAQSRVALEQGALASFGAALNEYGDGLREAGLECEATRADREALRRLPGVIATKGAGALQSDAVLVLLDDTNDANDAKAGSVIQAAERRGLKLISRGVSGERGAL